MTDSISPERARELLLQALAGGAHVLRNRAYLILDAMANSRASEQEYTKQRDRTTGYRAKAAEFDALYDAIKHENVSLTGTVPGPLPHHGPPPYWTAADDARYPDEPDQPSPSLARALRKAAEQAMLVGDDLQAYEEEGDDELPT